MVKLISKKSTDQYQRWDLPMVEDVSGAVANAKDDKAPGLMTAEQIERIQNQAYKEAYEAGFAKGREEGMVSGKDEIARNGQLLDDLLQSLSQPFDELNEDITQQLVSLSVAISRQLVRRELKIDATQIMGVVQEAIAVLPVGSRDVKVCLHPDDVKVMHETLAKTDTERSWELVNDSGLSRGDCRILTETSRIDATLEKRLSAIASRLLGGEREADNDSSSE
ncbi:MAG: flagellar assembly protein FliH [Gammaproteobacteria bacterium]|nr:flagellar assembly protein FliH [Gammaproteobacteria bacterium]